MSVLIETTIGDLTIDLDYKTYEVESYNFLKLCELNFYDYQCFYDIGEKSYVRFGDPLMGYAERRSIRTHNTSIKAFELYNEYYNLKPELIKATPGHKSAKSIKKGQLGFFCTYMDNIEGPLIGSQLSLVTVDFEEGLASQVFFGNVLQEDLPLLDAIQNTPTDNEKRPLTDIRIKKTHIIFDPFSPLEHVRPLVNLVPLESVRLPEEMLHDLRRPYDADQEIYDDIRRKELTLEIACNLPMVGIKPSDRVLFICKLNTLTKADDLASIFARFGKIESVEVVRNKESGRSLGYGFIEFENKKSCEEAYKKMEGVLIDDKRIHVNFSQSAKRNN